MTNVINMILSHKEFGNGQLKEFLGDYIVVRFANGTEKFPFPQAFEEELKTLNEDDAKKIEELSSRWTALAKEAEERALRAEKQPKEEKTPTAGKTWTTKITDAFKKILPKKKDVAPAENTAKEVEFQETTQGETVAGATEELAPAEENKETQE